MGALAVVGAWIVVAAVGSLVAHLVHRNSTPTPPLPDVAVYPPPVPAPTYITQAEVNRRFADLVVGL